VVTGGGAWLCVTAGDAPGVEAAGTCVGVEVADAEAATLAAAGEAL
jgi:hypothetical protein